MTEAAQAMTAETFEELYGESLLNGLSSVSTYIPLRTNARMGLNVAIRPRVFRVNDEVVFFGGTLRVGFTLNPDHTPVKAKVTALNDEVAEEQLRDFCKGFAWRRTSRLRNSTIVGVAVAASKYDGEVALERVLEDGVAADFLNRLERTYKQYNDATFMSKRKAALALRDAWTLQAQGYGIFEPLPETVQLPDGVVGTVSKVLNQAQDKYNDNVVAFQTKIADAIAEVVDSAEEEVVNKELA